jgi:hypothetical protein
VELLAGAADLFRRPPASEPALPGRRAALVPIAVPIVARPALVVIGSAPARMPRSSSHWAGRLLAAGLVTCGVLLTFDGIFDV